METGQVGRVVADGPGGHRAADDRVARLERARRVLRRVGQVPRTLPAPVGESRRDAVLPVPEPLTELFPHGGLRRGGTVALRPGPATTSLLLTLLAEASARGAWVGVVNRPDLGLAAAAEAGVRLDRLALVPHASASDLVAVTAALLDGLDLVALAGVEPWGLHAGERRRLAARARQSGAVLVALGAWPGADAELSCVSARWHGIGSGIDGGSGRLVTRDVHVRAHGRGIPPRGRSVRLRLPAPGGGVARAPLGVRESSDAEWAEVGG